MNQSITNLIHQAHSTAKEKGFWNDVTIQFQDQCIILIISEVTEALEALRKSNFGQIDKFNNCVSDETFQSCFVDYIKDSFQDEMADVCIRIFDYAGGFKMDKEKRNKGIQHSSLIKHYAAEREILAGEKVEHIPSYLLGIIRTLTDLKYGVWHTQYLGEVLGKIHHLMDFLGHDLEAHIELKMKYNATRGFKHGKSF